MMKLYDVTIIGGGPVGLYTAFYCGMREMKTKIIEYLPYLGGKVSYFYPEKVIGDIGGIPAITGEKLIKQLEDQARTFNPSIVVNQQVMEIERLADRTFLLTSHNGEKHHTKTIILATGFGTIKNSKLDLEHAEKYEGTYLFDTVENFKHFENRRVLIFGGGNSAVDWANRLLPIAKQVTIVHRRNEFTGIERNIANLKNSKAVILTPYILDALHGEEALESVLVKHINTTETIEIEVDAVLLNHGFSIDLGGIKQWGFEFENGSIKVDSTMQTNMEGIFAVGDIAGYINKLHLITGGFFEGPTAVNSAKAYIEPNKKLKPIFSTTHSKLQQIRKTGITD
ncbi:NAD(P)/FAD-dependent oxidoreductase [Neobacillus cucumis]|uniref:NAD(P)/FAD-dependent oxidoreductase n=1 Tax=Neobacillus cucumis TaxID=1740721 RepID=UPI00203C0A71|nr:NAD(P)/FAD-dependent oxidoreductase [Neobacillus cucumis]MCM3727586.1 NAD(P)/FAD-dependent oxidoreductase [Neobacillus cucumis]